MFLKNLEAVESGMVLKECHKTFSMPGMCPEDYIGMLRLHTNTKVSAEQSSFQY